LVPSTNANVGYVSIVGGNRPIVAFLADLVKGTSIYQGAVKNPQICIPAVKRWIENNGVLSEDDYFTISQFFISLQHLLNSSPDPVLLFRNIKMILIRIVHLCENFINPVPDPISIRGNERFVPDCDIPVDPFDDLRNGCWLPHLEHERKFAFDYESETRDPEVKGLCSHDMGGTSADFLPGIFTIMCPHGFYLGKVFFMLSKLTNCFSRVFFND
jgi:hypothetical protein